MRSVSRSGEGKLGCVIWLVILALAVFVAWKAVPIKLKATELYDFMEEQARFAGRASDDALRTRILRRAQQLQLPVTNKNIKVERLGGRIRMTCTFTVPLELVGYTYDWDFNLVVDRLIFVV